LILYVVSAFGFIFVLMQIEIRTLKLQNSNVINIVHRSLIIETDGCEQTFRNPLDYQKTNKNKVVNPRIGLIKLQPRSNLHDLTVQPVLFIVNAIVFVDSSSNKLFCRICLQRRHENVMVYVGSK
jgi:hypothetical protein